MIYDRHPNLQDKWNKISARIYGKNKMPDGFGCFIVGISSNAGEKTLRNSIVLEWQVRYNIDMVRYLFVDGYILYKKELS